MHFSNFLYHSAEIALFSFSLGTLYFIAMQNKRGNTALTLGELPE